MRNDVENMVELYFDGELEKGKEAMLFTLLSQDEDARTYFKQLNAFKTNIPFTMDELPYTLEKKILYTVAEKNTRQLFPFGKTNILSFASYALTIIFFVVSIFLFMQTNNYKGTLHEVSQQLENQKQEIQLLINSLPATEVTTKYENPVVVKANL